MNPVTHMNFIQFKHVERLLFAHALYEYHIDHIFPHIYHEYRDK